MFDREQNGTRNSVYERVTVKPLNNSFVLNPFNVYCLLLHFINFLFYFSHSRVITREHDSIEGRKKQRADNLKHSKGNERNFKRIEYFRATKI